LGIGFASDRTSGDVIRGLMKKVKFCFCREELGAYAKGGSGCFIDFFVSWYAHKGGDPNE